jgi:hypothetical protein
MPKATTKAESLTELQSKVLRHLRAKARAKRAYKDADATLEEILKERTPGDVIEIGKRKYLLKDEFAGGAIKAFRTTHFGRYSIEAVK